MAAGEQQLRDHLLVHHHEGEEGGRGHGGKGDIGEITSCGQFLEEAARENKKLWYLAGPAIFTSIAQYSLGAITQVFAGHLTTLELDAVSTENMVISGLAFGIMWRWSMDTSTDREVLSCSHAANVMEEEREKEMPFE